MSGSKSTIKSLKEFTVYCVTSLYSKIRSPTYCAWASTNVINMSGSKSTIKSLKECTVIVSLPYIVKYALLLIAHGLLPTSLT